MLIDTHTHIYLPEFDNDRDEMMERAQSAGVSKMLMPNIDCGSVAALHTTSNTHPQLCLPMMGLHPCSVDSQAHQALSELKQHFYSERRYCAVGEIGLDYYWSTECLYEQHDAFRTQLKWAKEFRLPVSIHCRNAKSDTSKNCYEDVIRILKEEKDENLNGVLHCFGGELQHALQLIELGFYLGIGGVLTYKNGGLDKILPDVPLQHIVLETDAPYLAPVPHRGKRNEPAYIKLVAEKLAELKGCTIQEVESQTTLNAQKIFSLTV